PLPALSPAQASAGPLIPLSEFPQPPLSRSANSFRSKAICSRLQIDTALIASEMTKRQVGQSIIG
ncbi:hypothetical protein, partial [Caballeronia sp. GAOx1]|uniref:hypothetical protein n=1 Tax=Caballeronia sp. GAOx1 TaxID=2921761 RepID=UPI0020277846